MRDRGVPPWLNWILPTSGLLRCLSWFKSDVSRLPVGPIFNALNMGAIGSPETSVSSHLTLRNNPEDGRNWSTLKFLKNEQMCIVGTEDRNIYIYIYIYIDKYSRKWQSLCKTTRNVSIVLTLTANKALYRLINSYGPFGRSLVPPKGR